MSNQSRGAVISLRISGDEQDRLRRMAEERGTSVSDLVRSLVSESVGPELPVGVTVSGTPSTGGSQIEHGVFWTQNDGSTIQGTTITLTGEVE